MHILIISIVSHHESKWNLKPCQEFSCKCSTWGRWWHLVTFPLSTSCKQSQQAELPSYSTHQHSLYKSRQICRHTIYMPCSTASWTWTRCQASGWTRISYKKTKELENIYTIIYPRQIEYKPTKTDYWASVLIEFHYTTTNR